MAAFSDFLDTLSDEELKLMDSDQEFFNQVKSQYESKQNKFPWTPQGYIPSKDPEEQKAVISEIPGLSPALVHGTTPLAEAIGETTQIPEKIRSPLSGLVGIAPEIAAGFAAPSAAKVVAPAVKSVLTKGSDVLKPIGMAKSQLGKAFAEKGLSRGLEYPGEAKSGNAMLEYLDGVRPLAKYKKEDVLRVFPEQEIVNKYDEIGRILDRLKVARRGIMPKELVSKKSIQELSSIKENLGSALKEVSPGIKEGMGAVSTAAKRNELLKTGANLVNPAWMVRKALTGF